MKKKLLLALATMVFLLSITLVGCQSGGIAQELYDQIAAQLEKAKEQLAKVQDEYDTLQAAKKDAESALKTARDKITEMEGQVSDLKEQYELTGATPAETAEKIIKYYHETHVYDLYDLFVCSDMSAEIWNMLKAQGINALMAVGDIDRAIDDITLCNHAWVLAEVAPGDYLALETTGGYTVPRSQSGLYYRGWTFKSPADLKSYNQLITKYNVKVVLRNHLAAEDREVVAEYNQSTNQQDADKLLAVHKELEKLIKEQEAELLSIRAELEGLATVLREILRGVRECAYRSCSERL